MARAPSSLYPTQTDLGDTGYPYGKAKNRAVPGDTTGTPLEQAWLNELWGFQQALLNAAALTPNGTAEQVGASQYLQAIQALIDAGTTPLATRADADEAAISDLQGRMVSQEHLSDYAMFRIVDATVNDTFHYSLTSLVDTNGNFTISGGNQVKVPRNGKWEITVSGHFKASDSTDATPILIWVEVPAGLRSSPSFLCVTQRAGTSPAETANLHRTFFANITDRATQLISVASGISSSSSQDSALIIRRVG